MNVSLTAWIALLAVVLVMLLVDLLDTRLKIAAPGEDLERVRDGMWQVGSHEGAQLGMFACVADIVPVCCR